jgi:4-azaleucine resistance transporter AzlC
MKNQNIIKTAFIKTIPVMLGYVPIGIAFGFLLVKSGFSWFLSPVMSILIYSGAAQFLAIEFFINNSPIFDVIITMLLLNLRHSFFGLSLFEKFSNIKFLKPYLIFTLTDETFALITTSEIPDEKLKSRYYFFLSFFDHMYWIIGSLIGALIGNIIKVNLEGLGFALTSLFVVLTIEQYNKIKKLKPFLIALMSGVLCLIFINGKFMLLVSIVLSVILILIFRDGKNNDK